MPPGRQHPQPPASQRWEGLGTGGGEYYYKLEQDGREVKIERPANGKERRKLINVKGGDETEMMTKTWEGG